MGANESCQCGDGTTQSIVEPKLVEILKDLTIVDVKIVHIKCCND